MKFIKKIGSLFKDKTQISKIDKDKYMLDNDLTVNFCIDVANKLPKNMNAVFYFRNGEHLELKTVDQTKTKTRNLWGAQ